jgi:N-acetylglutamate synthase-like GNAT family acetyltransferase
MAHDVQHPDGYRITDAPDAFDLKRAHAWIGGESYWAEGIPLETFRRAIENSLTLGVFAPDGEMAAMARVVTDRATFGWIADVFVDKAHRGHGLGKRIMAYLRGHPDLQGLRRLHLATRDAHGLYAQFGFVPLTKVESWMEIRDRDVYRR